MLEAASAISASFILDEARCLRPDRGTDSLVARRHLAVRVARDPLNLQAHVQRIHLLIDQGDGPRLAGALGDLFLALGDKGQGLRRTMLERAQPHLPVETARQFSDRLEVGLPHTGRLPAADGSVLCRGIAGSVHMVERQRATRPAETDAIDLAIMHLEHGDIDGAREVLETALLAAPADAALTTELLDLYRRSRDEAGFLAMRERLTARGASLGSDWDRF